MQHAIRRYIDQHLTDERLSPDDVARALEISRSSLYRTFRSEDGIAAHIRRRRLQAVHALLRMPGETRSIGELAETFGFSRASHFTTAFQRTFGCTPRLLRSTNRRCFTARSARDTAEAPAVFRDWIQEIRLR
ncbi:helix-turn-helix domain-containing protein [uncultured Methylobacterium sp.]|uniref:helix-turn-helix domain-containing protein n=1 Tax=uncultured Methylobacterium sp. TaxID=157278 RepID=UPI0035CC1B23